MGHADVHSLGPRRLNEAEIKEILRQHVGCVSIDYTCSELRISRRTYYRVIKRRAEEIKELHAVADRMAILYPLIYGLTHAPGDANNKLGRRNLELSIHALSPGLMNPVTAPRGRDGRAISVADALAAGGMEPPRRRARAKPPAADPEGDARS